MGYDLRLRVWRGDASGGDFASYVVPVEEGEVVLDAIHRLQAEQTPDLAVRWNCKAGKCGSCSAEINGKPRLMCMTRLSTFDPTETITVTPMRTFPVIRDLVTDVTFNYEKAREVPAFAPGSSNSGGAFRMAQVDVERGQEFRKCIECFLCQNTCHVIRDHEENKPAFAGPRFFIRYAELDMHPLDTLDRRQMAQDSEGLGYCNITKCCTEVCPEGIHITDNGIIPLKERVVDTKYDPVFLGLRIGRRKDRRVVGPAGGSGPSPIKRPGGVTPGSRTPTAPNAPAAAAASVAAPAASSAVARTTPAAEPAHTSVAGKAKTALPAVGAAAGIGFLAWAVRRSRSKHK
ncbi:MAG: succinate dehydrogenase / fumarate reductase, iron-sulfur subunit [Frankiaceae bacterium]|nr:succinate dehydrogenase / fumarate reductase, iron-sulfur subunit [Frankiaceae bacterium]